MRTYLLILKQPHGSTKLDREHRRVKLIRINHLRYRLQTEADLPSFHTSERQVPTNQPTDHIPILVVFQVQCSQEYHKMWQL